MDSFTQQFFLVLCCLCFSRISTQEMIRCSVPPVNSLQETVLTCYFPEDLSVSKKDFTVYHYVQPGSPDAVIDCWWVGGVLDCFAKPGFAIKKTISTTLNVTVSHVTSALTGTYACQVAGYGASVLDTCQLDLKLEESNTCSVSNSPFNSQITLTCFFNEDVQKTQTNFSVYSYDGQEKLKILNCWWIGGKPKCQVDDDYLYDNEVSTYLNIKIPKTTKGKSSSYSCWHAGSTQHQQKTCYLEISDKDSAENITTELAIGLSVAFTTVISAIILVAILLRLKRFNLRRQKRRTSADGADEPMINKESRKDKRTRMFQEHLVKSIEEMYPDTLKSFYFVPPVYLNKVRYETQCIAGHVVYVPQPPDLSDLRHDRAMQHVLHCLRHMAEHYEEQMFVLTQFKYEYYLNNPGNEFANHNLPVPAGLKSKKTVGNFDILIIHRRFGVLIGVVKSLSDKDDGDEDSKQKTDDLLVRQVCESVDQLKHGESMMRHLLSDQKQIPVRMTLILPNVSLSSLQRALGTQTQAVQRLCECTKVKDPDDPTQFCLCADHLSNPSPPWDVDSFMTSKLRNLWDRLMNEHNNGHIMTDGLYLNLIARFCGPATQFPRHTIGDTFVLTKTLAEAASFTGDMHDRLILYQDMIDLFREERLYLVGPPNTGKTRMLTLVGEQWIADGHNVYILFGCSVQCDPVMSAFCNKLKEKPEKTNTDNSLQSIIIKITCNFNLINQVNATVDWLIKNNKSGPLRLLADEVDVGGKYFKTFCETLKSRCPEVYLWATTSTDKDVPDGWKVQQFTRSLNCPPSVVREAVRAKGNYFLPGDESIQYDYLPLTDGLPVKYIYDKTNDSRRLGGLVADFLNKHIVHKNSQNAFLYKASDETDSTIPHLQCESTTLKESSVIGDKDILVFFENDKFEDIFLKELKKSGLKVRPLKIVEGKEVVKEDKDCVCIMNVDFLRKLRERRKIVVYVESESPPTKLSIKWRGITSCTSQLIVVRWNTQ